MQRVRIGSRDLAAGENLVAAIEIDDFIARAEERDLGSRMHERLGAGDRRQDAQLSGAQRRARRQYCFAPSDVLAAAPDVASRFRRHGDFNPFSRERLGVFLSHHGVGALRQRCAGEYPRRFAGRDRLGRE